MGAYVVYDPYWDPVDSYATEAEAQRSCQPGSDGAAGGVLDACAAPAHRAG